MLGLLTDLRPEEAGALTWDHVHLDGGRPHIDGGRSSQAGGDTPKLALRLMLWTMPILATCFELKPADSQRRPQRVHSSYRTDHKTLPMTITL